MSYRLTKEEVKRIIEMCELIERSGTDPFRVNVKQILDKLRKYLEGSEDVEDLVLDAETMYRIALLISFQGRWLKERASSLFIDHQVIASKIINSENKDLALALLRNWKPVVRLEQLTSFRLMQGMEHFMSLPQLSKEVVIDEEGLEEIAGMYEDYRLEEEVVEERIMSLYDELKIDTKSDGHVDYWEFIIKEGEENAFDRAYLVSFMVSEGLADMKLDPITGRITLWPLERKREGESKSLVITLMPNTLDRRC